MNRFILSNLFMFFVLCLSVNQVVAQKPSGNPEFLKFAEKSANWTYENKDSIVDLWKNNFDPGSIFGYRPPSRLLETATIYAHLYELKKKKEYAQRAKDLLLEYDSYKSIFPDWAVQKRPDYTNGVPALPDFFTAQRFIRPYEILVKHNILTPEEKTDLRQVISHSMNYLLQSQEWGAMNRAALRAETLAWAIRSLPDHPDVDTWKMYEKALSHDNWGAWQIEDATHYNAIWLYAMIGYGYASDQLRELFYQPEMYYYSEYYKNLFCPDMSMPDFGDSYWQSNWSRWLVYFETCAGVYGSQEHKWMANKISDKFVEWEKIENIGLAYIMLDCYLLGDETVDPKVPESGSMEVMEDVIGKKIVMRSGWAEEDSYLLLNYKDEGEAGYLSRQFLRDGIVVEEEKMTHGHADENSIVLLMDEGSVLLHDGGYRDFMPSGPYGAYRQDYFHNRLCVRPEKIFFGQKEGEFRYDVPDQQEVAGQNILDFLRNSGGYQSVKTEKIDFLTYDDFDYSRTRVHNDRFGYESDRIVVWLKEANIYVVFDMVKSTREGFLTAANLWHTRSIIDRGDNWFLTGYDSLRNIPMQSEKNLMLLFPDTHYKFLSVTPEQRYWQDEIAIAQYSGQYFETGQMMGFVTVLIPGSEESRPADVARSISLVPMEEFENGMAIQVIDGAKKMLVGAKLDLRKEMFRDHRRPKYTYESGRVKYGPVESNCDLFVLKDSGKEMEYTLVNVSKALYNGQNLFEQKPNYFGLAFDGKGDVSGISKARSWRGKLSSFK